MKIRYNDYRYIMGLKKKPIFIQTLLRYDLILTDGSATIKTTIPVWLYALMFIPAHLLLLVMCLWDGGLKEFEIESRNCPSWHFQKGDVPYERAKEIYEKN